ncbi:unnamed protein product, partial [marine sediment metagenome]
MKMKGLKSLAEEEKTAICQDYLKGEKVVIIAMEHEAHSATIYRVLHERNIKLRRASPKPQPAPEPEVPTPESLFSQRVEGLVSRAGVIPPDMTLDVIYGVLIKTLKEDPVGTINTLFPAGNTFTAEMAIQAAAEYYITRILDSMPEFENLGEGKWKLKEGGVTQDETIHQGRKPG